MKKIVAAFLMMFMIVGLCACGTDTNDTTSDTDKGSAESVSVDETTEAESNALTSETTNVSYVVTVVDSDNNPIPNAILQMCKLGDDGSCTPGNPSDAEGKVVFSLPEDDYKVSFIVVPTGYTYVGEEKEFYFEEGSTELTITLAKAD